MNENKNLLRASYTKNKNLLNTAEIKIYISATGPPVKNLLDFLDMSITTASSKGRQILAFSKSSRNISINKTKFREKKEEKNKHELVEADRGVSCCLLKVAAYKK